MTVPTTSNKVIGTGNGVSTVFPFTFGTLTSGDLVVTLFDTDGIEYAQAETTDYTVSGKGEEDGGAVTFLSAPANGWTVLIQRVLPETQPTDLKNQGSFYPRTIERMFDRVTFLIQQLAERIASALTLPPQVEGVSLQLPVPEASALIGWSSGGDAIENFPLATIATQITYGDKSYQTFTGTGAQVNFILSQNPGSLGNLDVSIDGVTQVPGADYTYAGTTLTFSTAPANSAVILVRYDIAVPVGTALASATQFTQSGSGAVQRSVQDRLRDTVSIKDFGSFGDGILFDDLPFQRAIAFASSTSRNVFIPAGTYRLAATVQVPAGVHLIGEGAKPYTGPNNVTATTGAGSWLHFDHSGIGLQFVGGTAASASSGLSSCGTMRTHAAPGGGWTATVYDYDIDVQGVETLIEDVVLLNAYKGIRIINSGYGRLWLNRVRGQAFNEFINLEQSYDTSRVTNCHQWPYWSQHSAVTAYQQTNLKAYRIARSDTTILSGCFSIYQNVGLEVYGTVNGTAYRLRVTDCEFDHTTYGVRVLASADDASILFSGLGSFGATGSTTSRGVWIESTNSRYSFSNTDVSLFALDGIRVDGTNNILQMCNTRVRYYDQQAVGAAAYEVAATNLMEFADRPYVTNGGAGPMFGAVANVYKAPLGGGLVGGTTDGSGDYTVTHGLGTSPIVQVSGIANGSNRVALKSQSSTNFVVTLYDAAGTPQAATALNFNWFARKE